MKFELKKLDNNRLSFKILEQEAYLTINGKRSEFMLFDTLVSVESCNSPDLEIDSSLTIYLRGDMPNRDNDTIFKKFDSEIERDYIYDLIILAIKHHIIKVKKENNI